MNAENVINNNSNNNSLSKKKNRNDNNKNNNNSDSSSPKVGRQNSIKSEQSNQIDMHVICMDI